MKKVVLSVFAFVMFSAVSAQAQTATQTQTGTQTPATTGTTQTGTQGATQNAASAAGAAGQANTTAATPAAAAAATETKTAVTVEELPEAVKTTLATPTLKVWTPYEAYLVKGTDGKEYYAINLKKDTQTGSVKLDKEGKPVK